MGMRVKPPIQRRVRAARKSGHYRVVSCWIVIARMTLSWIASRRGCVDAKKLLRLGAGDTDGYHGIRGFLRVFLYTT